MDKRPDFLPLCKPMIGEEEIHAVSEVLRSGWLTTGKEVKEFEKEVATYVGTKEALGLTSCTGALHLALAAKGIGPGDEVIVPTFTFVATAHVVAWLGAKPVLVDSDPETCNIDSKAFEAAITPKTKAVIPVHFAGNPCDMDAIMEIAKKHGIFVLEDAAHAIGASYKGRMVGSIGDATAFSFYAIKNMTTAEGGMVTSDDQELMARMRKLAYFGVSRDAFDRYGKTGSWYYEIESLGYKYNMDNLQGAMGRVQLQKLEGFNRKREKLATRYTQRLKDIPGIRGLPVTPRAQSAWHLYTILVGKEFGFPRDELVRRLADWNVGTSVHFIPLHLHPFYKQRYGYKEGDLPVAEALYHAILSLPLFPGMSEADVDYVADVIKGAADNEGK